MESECLVWKLESWALGGDPEEGSLSGRAPRPHRGDTHCAGRGGGRAASPSHRTRGSAAPAPCSSHWTGGANGIIETLKKGLGHENKRSLH